MNTAGVPVFRVGGMPAYVMDQHAADVHGERLGELASSVGVDIPAAMIRMTHRINGEPFYGKFLHSIYVTDETGNPVALLGGHEQAPDPPFTMPVMMVAVLAVDEKLHRQGLAIELAAKTTVRSVSLGWTELPVPKGTPITLACQVMDVSDRRWLIDLYERDFNFERVGESEFFGDPMVQLISRI